MGLLDTGTKKLFLTLAILVIVQYFFNREGFSIFEINQGEQVPPNPETYLNPDTRTLMSGYDLLPTTIIPPWGAAPDAPNNDIDDKLMRFNLCSPLCCSQQWPLPFKLGYDRYVCNSEQEYMPTTMTCNNSWQNSGCACVNKSQYDFLVNRGNNI